MARVQHSTSQLNRQLLASTARKLLGLFSASGDALISSGLRYSLLTLYVAAVYVVVLALGGITNEHTSVPWWLNLIALLIIVPTFLPMHG